MAENSRQAELRLLIKEVGAKETAAEIQKLGTATLSVQRELTKIARTDQIQKIGTEMGLLAKKTRDVSGAVAELSKKLSGLGATQDEIRAATSAFSAAQTGGQTNRLARLGSEVRALPSQRIPGLDIGTDAIGNFLRLGGAITGISEKTAETSKVAQALAPTLGQAGAGLAAMALQAAPFLIAAAAVGFAIKSLTDEVGRSADVINKTVDAQRAANQEIVAGLTSDEVRKKQEDLNQARLLEQQLLDKTTATYAEFERQTQAAVDSGQDLAGALTDIIFGQGATVAGAKAVRADEDALNQQRETSVANLAKIDAQTADYNTLLESGALAANDAAEAEKRLAEERTKTALASADSAAKELQAEQKALGSTAEQNEKRLTAIEDERAVIERQLEVLTESGVTSEEVTAKIALLNDQLGLLGKESSFITDKALEQSRARDAEKKAAKDAEEAEKKAAQAQEQYTKTVKDASSAYKNSVKDIGTRLNQTLQDNQTKFNRDLIGLTVKNQQDEYDLQRKAERAERDAVLNQIDDLDKLRKDAQKDAQEALREGDFKQLFLSREAAKEAEMEQQDEINKERDRRSLAQRDNLEDLRLNFERQRLLRKQGYEYGIADAQTAQQRELRQAVLTRQRALQVASEGMNADLAMRGQYWNAVVKQTQQALGQLTGAQGRGPNMPAGGPKAFSFTASLAKVIG
jgi:hypothetical protein